MGECRGSVMLGKWPKGHLTLQHSLNVETAANESWASMKTELDINSLMRAVRSLAGQLVITTYITSAHCLSPPQRVVL